MVAGVGDTVDFMVLSSPQAGHTKAPLSPSRPILSVGAFGFPINFKSPIPTGAGGSPMEEAAFVPSRAAGALGALIRLVMFPQVSRSLTMTLPTHHQPRNTGRPLSRPTGPLPLAGSGVWSSG